MFSSAGWSSQGTMAVPWEKGPSEPAVTLSLSRCCHFLLTCQKKLKVSGVFKTKVWYLSI